MSGLLNAFIGTPIVLSIITSLIILLFGGKSLGYIVAILFLGFWFKMVFKGGGKRAENAFEKFKDTLMKDEKIIEQGIDSRPFGLLSRRKIFAVTNSRVIEMNRGILGGYKMRDFQWKDLKDAEVHENIWPSLCGSTLSFKSNLKKDSLDFNIEVYPQSKIATSAYKHAQMEEQAWEEKRRVRAMEEQRAQAGGIMIGNQSSPSTKVESNNEVDITDQLLKLKKLLDEGVLNDAEFQEMKAKLLSKQSQNF